MSRHEQSNHVDNTERLAWTEPSVITPQLGGVALGDVGSHIRHNSGLPPSGFELPQQAGVFALRESAFVDAQVEVGVEQPPAEYDEHPPEPDQPL